jgi:hypothetical protein
MTTIRGIRIPALSRAHAIKLPAEDSWVAIQQALGGRNFDVVGCCNGIDLFVDDEGAVNGSAFNLPVTILAHILGHPAALFGDAVALSSDDEGDIHGLSDEQFALITDAMSSKPTPKVVESIASTLSVHSAFDPIVAALRAL